jgi:hypothetical protein
MKFVVMCTLEPAGGRAPDQRIVDAIAGLGLRPVASVLKDEEWPPGSENAFVGEFRAGTGQVLESMLREQISALLCRFGSGIRFKLHLLPTAVPIPDRKLA